MSYVTFFRFVIILSDAMQDSIEIMDIIPSVQSDHSLLKLKITPINERTRGPSSWKFNSSLVNDSDFVEQMKLKVPAHFIKNHQNCQTLEVAGNI